MDDTLEAYTDGSSLPSPRRGGIGIRFVWCDEETGEEVIDDLSYPGYKGGTNQEMEILACKTALEESVSIPSPDSTRRLVIHTDSLYVQQNYKNALFKWPPKWLRKSGAPVENAEDWKELIRAFKKAKQRFEVLRIEWIPGKSKNPHIRAAHKLAQASARNATKPPRKVKNVRRKESPEIVDRGSVKMEGQTLTIRIRNSNLLKIQKVWRCTYEVVLEDSPHTGKADIIFSERNKRLDAGHTYVVRVNDDTNNPWIEEILHEVLPQTDTEDGGTES
jgi:ribonuclease HI